MLNNSSQLVGKFHYQIKTGATIEFDQFNDEGEIVGTMEVVTAEPITVYVENSQVSLSSFKNLEK